jgi:hypothetical protein
VFERGPFQQCWNCQRPDTLGILSAGGATVTRRCKCCRFSFSEELPPLQKDVVYLDQLAISEIFKSKTNRRRPGAGREEFWKNVEREANRAYLLQQVIFPESNIHRDETIVSSFPSELSLAHEMMSGDISFSHINEIEMSEVIEFAKAYWEKRPIPSLTFDVDITLDGNRNEWLRDMHVTANMDFSMFANRIRANREAGAAQFNPLLEKWARDKPSFNEALAVELKNYGELKRSTLRYALERQERAFLSLNPLDLERYPIIDEFQELKSFFERMGVSSTNSATEVNNYWNWSGNEHIPSHRISAYLFAALARRMASGQKRLPSRGIFNDIRAISTYGPYVDAMFLDNECAQLLKEEPLRSEINLKAKIFSTKSGNAFLDYLLSLQARASPEVRKWAIEIYGIDP